MKMRYKKLIDTPKSQEEREEFNKIYEKYKGMFKYDPMFIGIICRREFGNNKKKRVRFGNYAIDMTLIDLYHEKKVNKTIDFVK